MVVGTRASDRLDSLIGRVRRGEQQVIDLGERAIGESWEVSPVERHSPYVAFVPIIEGCNKFCSFCIVPYSRGREQSRTPSEIVAEVNRLRELGYQEVHLIGQNVNSYRPRSDAGLEGFPGATPFCRLLRAVAATGIRRIKFTTSFPRDFHPDIVAALEEFPNLCDWVHLPVQSGSDGILKAMRRGHGSADYLRRVDAIKNSRRRLALTSDIIVGFPGETDADFRETVKLVEKCEFDALYIFKYSQRRGTPAAKLPDDVSEDQKKQRFLELEARHRELQKGIHESYVGRQVSVLVEGKSARSPQDMTGHSSCHKVVNFHGGVANPGAVVNVLITEAKLNSLYGAYVS
jgi:tRNA-2-methylthio-N6-dimethylallyladenosine synthase